MRPRKHRRRGCAPAGMDESFIQGLLGNDSDSTQHQPKPSHKAQMLARQAQRVLSLSLSGECNDDLLREVLVLSVEPANGDGSLLLAQLVPPRGADPIDLLRRLDRCLPLLRREIARAITRKRSPEIHFVLAASPSVPLERQHDQ